MENKKNDNGLIFGNIDISTGLTEEGFVENEEMRFKKTPWYKKLFAKEPSEIELIGITSMYSQFIWSNKKNHFDSAVYKKYNPFTGKIQCIYTNTPDHDTVYFDVCVYEKYGKLVQK